MNIQRTLAAMILSIGLLSSAFIVAVQANISADLRSQQSLEGSQQTTIHQNTGPDRGTKLAQALSGSDPNGGMSLNREKSNGFIFGCQQIYHTTNRRLWIRLGERISPHEFKRRFWTYHVRYAKGEGCLTCAVITGADGQIEVSFEGRPHHRRYEILRRAVSRHPG